MENSSLIEDVEIEILEDGSLKFCRCKKPLTNEALFSLLEEIMGDKSENIKEFFDCSDKIKVLFGKETFCG